MDGWRVMTVVGWLISWLVVVVVVGVVLFDVVFVAVVVAFWRAYSCSVSQWNPSSAPLPISVD